MSDSERPADRELLLLLLHQVSAGTLAFKDVEPLIRELLPGGQPGGELPELLARLDLTGHETGARLAEKLRAQVLNKAALFFNERAANPDLDYRTWPLLRHLPAAIPANWRDDGRLLRDTEALLRIVRDQSFLRGAEGSFTELRATLDADFRRCFAAWRGLPAHWQYFAPRVLWAGFEASANAAAAIAQSVDLVPQADDEQQLAALVRELHFTATAEARRALLTRLLTWPDAAAAAPIVEACKTAADQQFALPILMLRFGKVHFDSWNSWAGWLASQDTAWRQRLERAQSLCAEYCDELRWLWCQDQELAVPDLLETLADSAAAKAATTVDASLFVRRWERLLLPAAVEGILRRAGVSPERASAAPAPAPQPAAPLAAATPLRLTMRPPSAGAVPPVLPAAPPPMAPPPRVRAASPPPPPQPVPAAPPEPASPSVWDEQVRPFLAANWYMVAGLLMVLVGASLLAYFTWDKHWILRYTIMPTLLAGFTLGLAELGVRLGRRHEDLRGTAAMFLGGAVGLLPLNFTVLCLVSGDQSVPSRLPILLLLTAAYLLIFGVGARRWSRAVEPALANLLPVPLLVLNALIALAALAPHLGCSESRLPALLPLAMNLGCVVLLLALWQFAERTLTGPMLAKRRVPWFFAATLALTVLQVFAWLHVYLKVLPLPEHYALLLVLIGASLLHWERRVLELRAGAAGAYGSESFLGYAAVFAGILAGAHDPYMRIAVLLLAGLVWLRQAARRPGVVHHWIGMTLLLLGGAAVALLDEFPKSREANLLPALGLALALLTGVVRALAHRCGNERLRQVAVEIQAPVLLLTAIVAVLSQWHFRSEPLHTGGTLLLVAAFFVVRALAVGRLSWLHTAMTLATLALPYLGCADMRAYDFRENTMILGLALLSAGWLATVGLARQPLLQQARATVVTLYGLVGVATVTFYLLSGPHALEGSYAQPGGVLLMAATLLVAAWYSRSLLPGLTATVLLAVILPALPLPQSALQLGLSEGTGLPSAGVALALLLGCFLVRARPGLQALAPGDSFAEGVPFPFVRGDASVFTVPMLAAAFYLAQKVCCWNLLRLEYDHLVGWPTVTALGLAAATWLASAIYLRRYAASRLFFHLSWLTVAVALVYVHRLTAQIPRWQYPALWLGLYLQVLWFVCRCLQARRDWLEAVLARPTLRLLKYGSLLLTGAVAFEVLVIRCGVRSELWLPAFLGVQLAWHGLRTRRLVYGGFLFGLAVVVLQWQALGAGDSVLARLTLNLAARPVLGLLLAVLALLSVLEVRPAWHARVAPLLAPFLAGSTLLVLAFAAAVGGDMLGTGDAIAPLRLSRFWFLLCALILTGRAQGSAAFPLLAALLAYLRFGGGSLHECLIPWRLGLFGLGLALVPFAGRFVRDRWPQLLNGAFAQLPQASPQAPWFGVTALAAAGVAAAQQATLSWGGADTTSHWLQVSTFFDLVLACTALGWYWRSVPLFTAAAILLPVANVGAVAILAGHDLLSFGLSEVHLIAIGLLLSVAEFHIVIRCVGARFDLRRLADACVALAGAVLALLAMNYLVYPDLTEIPEIRFVISGLLAVGAGLYLRQAARQPDIVDTERGKVRESLYHVSLGVALWCAVLLVPALRSPQAALFALAVPALLFWLLAESGLRATDAGARLTGERFRNSAAVFAALILALYAGRAAFQLIAFPGTALDLHTYHVNAPLVVLLGFVLFRLRGLGGRDWQAAYGGFALMTATYFCLTWYPGLSPFEFPMSAAWAGAVLAHFFVLLSYRQSPLRNMIQQLGGLGAAEWDDLRHGWGRFLLVAAHLLLAWGLAVGLREHSREAAPLLVLVAALLVHQGVLGDIRWYYGVAAVEVLLALHLDFLLPPELPSLLPAKQVIWVLLGLWGVLALGWNWLKRWVAEEWGWLVGGLLLVLCLAHVFYHGPATGTGLVAVLAMTVFGALTPMPARCLAAGVNPLLFSLFLLAPAWLCGFGQVYRTGGSLAGLLPLLSGLAAWQATGAAVRWCWNRSGAGDAAADAGRLRFGHGVLTWCRRDGATIALAVLVTASLALTLLTVAHYERPDTLPVMFFLAVLWGAAGATWFQVGMDRPGVAPNVLAQLCLAGMCIVVRRELWEIPGFWSYEYDIWATLGISLCLGATKQLIFRQEPGLRRALEGTLWVLPLFQFAWIWFHGLGADISLVALGLQAVVFVYLGGGRRESPYNAVAVLGFVAFVLLFFWSKLDLRCIQAYAIPVGLGVLGLLHLFGQDLRAQTKNEVRMVTLVVMLGSSGYYALASPGYAVGFHLTMILLCLGVMALGSFMRVQLYLFLGFAGLAMDLAALTHKLGRHLDKTVQMMAVGALLLTAGVLLVVGAAYFKTHRDRIRAWTTALRAKLKGWE